MAKGCRVISPSSNLNIPAYTDMFIDDKTMLHNDNKTMGETTVDIRSEELPQNDVYLKNAARARTQLARVEASTEIEVFGIQKLATLCEKEEMKYIKSKARKYVKAISSCPLQKHEVWLSYKTVLNSSLTYFLATTSFTAKEFDKVHKK
eukprot:2780552-Ditylum_brightwellii.AAC.1